MLRDQADRSRESGRSGGRPVQGATRRRRGGVLACLAMALEYCVLASGSRGNSVWVRGGGVELLVDCGLAARTLEARLASVGRELGAVQAVFCTHGHGDHVGGAAVLARKLGLAIHGTRTTLRCIPGEPPQEALHLFPRTGVVRLGGLEIRTAPTPHDITGSCAFVVSDGETSLGVVTDLGHPAHPLVEALGDLDGLVLESNHDVTMLREGPYPAHLKRRIESRVGHLSNEQSAAMLLRLAHPGLQHVTLAHLSEQNNDPSLARDEAEAVLARAAGRPNLAVSTQDRAGEPVLLRPRPRKGQLALF